MPLTPAAGEQPLRAWSLMLGFQTDQPPSARQTLFHWRCSLLRLLLLSSGSSRILSPLLRGFRGTVRVLERQSGFFEARRNLLRLEDRAERILPLDSKVHRQIGTSIIVNRRLRR